MKKIAHLGLILTLFACSTARAHIGGLVFPVYELATFDLPDLHDGTLEDWEDVLPGTSLTHDDFAPLNVSDGAGIDPADLAYRTFMAWSSSEKCTMQRALCLGSSSRLSLASRDTPSVPSLPTISSARFQRSVSTKASRL